MWAERKDNGHVKFIERYEDPMSGKTKRVSVTLESDNRNARKLATQILEEKIQKLTDGSGGNPQKEYTLTELTDLYHEHQKKSNAISTAERNYASLTSINEILGGDTLVSRLTARYINERFSDSDKEPRTLNAYLGRFKAFIRWCYDNDYVEDISFLEKVRTLKDAPHRTRIQDKYLEKDELEKVLLAMQGHVQWMLLTKFLAFSGLRFGEFCALNNSDVDLDNLVIHVTKTYDSVHAVTSPAKSLESIRDVHITPELLPVCRTIRAEMLRRRLSCRIGRDCDLFMFDEEGGHIDYYAYNKYLKKKAMDITGKTITPHALRHTHASLLYEQGLSVDEVARRLGHANSKVTREIYLHVTQKLREKDNARLDKVRLIGG